MKKTSLMSKFFQSKILIPFLVSLLTLIIGFLGGISYSKYFPSQKNTHYPRGCKVKRVIDGDTLELETGQTLRLYGISCPEKGDEFYQEAKELTEMLALDKPQALDQSILIEYEEKYKEDKYGRLLGYVILPYKSALPQINLNVNLVRSGFCKPVIYKKRAKLIYQDELLKAEEAAKQENKGIWKKE